jgi:hypothetical protein
MTRKGAEKRLKQEKNDKNRIQAPKTWLRDDSASNAEKYCSSNAPAGHCADEVNLERCNLCMESWNLSLPFVAAKDSFTLLDSISKLTQLEHLPWQVERDCWHFSGKKFFRKDAIMSVSPHACPTSCLRLRSHDRRAWQLSRPNPFLVFMHFHDQVNFIQVPLCGGNEPVHRSWPGATSKTKTVDTCCKETCS